jgi:hypothetical protein
VAREHGAARMTGHAVTFDYVGPGWTEWACECGATGTGNGIVDAYMSARAHRRGVRHAA